VQFGRYTKIGNRVLFNIYITLSAKGTSTGSTQIGGLPFTSASDAEAAASIINSNVTYTGQIGALVPESQTVLNIYNLQTTAGLTFLTDTGLANNSLFILAGQYKT
jgi:hypothetical protein